MSSASLPTVSGTGLASTSPSTKVSLDKTSTTGYYARDFQLRIPQYSSCFLAGFAPAEATDSLWPFTLSYSERCCPMSVTRRLIVVMCCLSLWLLASQVWGQNIAVFPKEDILLVGGDFRLRSIFSNIAGAEFDRESPTFGGGESGGLPTEDGNTKSFFDTRLRLYWDFRPSTLLRIHYRMEIGDVRFGGGVEDGSDTSGNLVPVIGPGSGGGVGADGVNVETKNIFLELRIPAIRGLSFRGGIFGYGDRYGFNILADDFAGLQILYQRGDVTAHFIYLKFFEGDTRQNADDSDWFGIDGELKISPSTTVASTFYFWADRENQELGVDNPYQMWFGGEITSRLTSPLGPVLVNGYVIYNQGEGFFGRRSGDNHGWNFSLAGDLHLKVGTVGLQVQYISGEEGSKQQIEGSAKGGEDISAWVSYFNNMYGGPEIISRGPIIDVGDGFNSKWGTGNGFFNGDYNGRLLVIARSAFPLTPDLTLHLVGAYDRAAEANMHGDHERGIEVDLWVQWNILPKLWLRIGGGYYFTGNWWENNSDASFDGRTPGVSNPDDIWQFGTRLQYDFG
jgi:hypothetical protein